MNFVNFLEKIFVVLLVILYLDIFCLVMDFIRSFLPEDFFWIVLKSGSSAALFVWLAGFVVCFALAPKKE